GLPSRLRDARAGTSTGGLRGEGGDSDVRRGRGVPARLQVQAVGRRAAAPRRPAREEDRSAGRSGRGGRLQLLLDLLPARHQLVEAGGQGLLLVLELADLGGGGLVEEAGVAEELRDLVDALLGAVDLGGQAVAL